MAQTTLLKELTDANFTTEVINSSQPVLVDFYADWCGPCRLLGPVIEEVAAEVGDQAKVGKLDVGESTATAETYHVSSIPTVLLFQNGQVVRQFVGVQPKSRYLDAIRQLTDSESSK